jgi:hypothetical protein
LVHGILGLKCRLAKVAQNILAVGGNVHIRDDFDDTTLLVDQERPSHGQRIDPSCTVQPRDVLLDVTEKSEGQLVPRDKCLVGFGCVVTDSQDCDIRCLIVGVSVTQTTGLFGTPGMSSLG